MKKWVVIATWLDKLNQGAAVIARWSVLVMLGIGFWNVIGRYLGVAIGQNLSSNRLIESQWYLFDVIFLLGLGWTFQKQGHVRVDVLQSRWGSRRKIKVELLGALSLLLPFAIAVLVLSISPAVDSWMINEASPDPDGLPRYWMKSLVPVSFLLLILQGFSSSIQNLVKLKYETKFMRSSEGNKKELNRD